MHDDAVVRVRVHGPASAPRLFLSHGNGFAIDGYYPFWRLLAGRYEVVLHDVRNHGRNPFHTEEAHGWSNFERDVGSVRRGVARRLGDKPAAGIYHSLSAIAAIRHAGSHGWTWRALVLFEPPLLPPRDHPLRAEARRFEERLAAWSAKRQARLADPDELAERWRRTNATRRWLPEAYGLMARSILRRDGSTGDWCLACPPACEARVYRGNIASNDWSLAAKLPHEGVLIVGSDTKVDGVHAPAKSARAVADRFGLAYRSIANTSHLMQIERPERCAAIAESVLATAFAAGRPG